MGKRYWIIGKEICSSILYILYVLDYNKIVWCRMEQINQKNFWLKIMLQFILDIYKVEIIIDYGL